MPNFSASLFNIQGFFQVQTMAHWHGPVSCRPNIHNEYPEGRTSVNRLRPHLRADTSL